MPLPSLKIQIMGGKVCLMCKGKTLLVVVNIPQQCFALLPQVNFPTKNLNLTKGEGDGIEFRPSS